MNRPLAVAGIAALAGCFFACSSSPGENVAQSGAAVSSAHAHPFDIGANEWTSEMAPFEALRAASGAAGEPRLCHVYTYWDIANHDPAGGDQSHTRSGLIQWFGQVASDCDEVLVTFQGPQQSGEEAPPSVADFESSFVDFQNLTNAGAPLAAWNGKLTYTPWNEPNNSANSGNGLQEPISPELAVRRHCDPSASCKVAAGDFATNGGTANDIEWNCADDNVTGDTPTSCAAPSRMNTTGLPPSYLDRYKNYIAVHASDYGLSSTFRPEYFAYHPWHDVNSYIESNAACDGYDDCVTRRLLQSLGGSWSGAELWDTEIGVGLQTTPAPNPETTQPCGAAFLVQMTDLSPRFTRVYYMRFAGGNGPLFDGTTMRPAGQVLASGALVYEGTKCGETGMLATYANPIIPMFKLPSYDTSAKEVSAAEGCPDPTGIKTSTGEFYIYCTSYTVPYDRYDGFPIFKSSTLAGNSWERVGSIIPDSGRQRTSWPTWIKDSNGNRFGNFWAPDVHELPSGKFVATYAAPCGSVQCVGMAWADGPEGPWTHVMDHPFISKSNNGAGYGSTYDPNLLVDTDGQLYLYWVVVGGGIYGATVTAAPSGEIAFASSPVQLVPWGSGGEGPYMIDRGGVYYLFFSNDPTGGILYNYQLHVRRSSSPLGGFQSEDQLVLQKSRDANGEPVSGTAFVATGGNSVIQDAADGADFLVYHAIKVPDGGACPGHDPASGSLVEPNATTNPYCRVQGERQAMLDPITWKPDGAGGVWPTVNDGRPSYGAMMVP